MNIAFEEYGISHEKTILFIHGAGLPGWFWKKQIEYFSKNYHCIVVDLPDHGKSSSIEFTTIEHVANELLFIIEKYGHNKKSTVVGHSLGAKVATFMIAKNSGFIERAIIASALFHKSIIMDLMNNKMLIKLNVNWVKSSPKLLNMQAKSFHFDDKQMEYDFIEEYKTLDYKSVERYLNAFAVRMELPDNLSSVTIPVLILAGEKEPASMKKSVFKLLGAIKDSKSIILAKCNHIYPVQAPALFNTIVENWMNGKLSDNDKIMNQKEE
jgi:pimeloyl-ACP methyl ester carboxylesterase